MFCVGWPKKGWMAMRGVAGVFDTQDSFSFIHLSHSKRRDADRVGVVAVIERQSPTPPETNPRGRTVPQTQACKVGD